MSQDQRNEYKPIEISAAMITAPVDSRVFLTGLAMHALLRDLAQFDSATKAAALLTIPNSAVRVADRTLAALNDGRTEASKIEETA